ncbi:class I SAM-dependent methyltransferase [Oscillatoria sp. FACHB-1407]|uniref:class I SAM-dependent methyltransferase n=1 Tax=Oscillatoria sp. FACHB-1407 TaxID=2692847 RepID=UPI001683EEFC|nr:class I SAM-dependent methyltransferase [Oscillatoria sp. FACHB-1407]MBD2459669.1 class I SAM-dependent methyltransferase [Oscillatoria sp. FACHB-1407]
MSINRYLKELYANRFDPSQQRAKNVLWKVLVRDYLQQYIKIDSAVLDIGGGYCEFLNHVQAASKHLIDLNPDAKLFANADIEIFNINILKVDHDDLIATRYDVIFISNFFEHLASKEELFKVLEFCFDHLVLGGSLLIIQPNFKYSMKEYYDFIDHQLPITHLSLVEALRAVNFEIDVLIPQFLPFSTKGRPSAPWMLRLYLRLPILWRFLGGQMFIRATKR